jgi:hypothetical protein
MGNFARLSKHLDAAEGNLTGTEESGIPVRFSQAQGTIGLNTLCYTAG